MPPSAVNNSGRQMEARIAEILADMGGALVAGGTANALTVTANSAFTAYDDGLMLALRIATDNTSAATLNANAIGVKAIRKMVGSGEVALSGGELQATGIYLLRYSTALNAAAGGWLLLNPTVDVPSLAPLASPTFTGTPAAPTATAGTSTTQIATTGFVTGGIATAIAALSAVYQPLSAALTALAGIGTAVAGDIIYASGAGTWARKAKGTDGQFLSQASGIPAWATLPFSKSFESAQQAITAGGSLTLAHGLGAKPKLYLAALQCTTANIGYSIGDEVLINPNSNATDSSDRNDQGISLVPDSTNISIRFGSDALVFAIIRKDNGGSVSITPSSWQLVVRAWA